MIASYKKREGVHFKSFPLFIYNSSNKRVLVQKPIDFDLFYILEAKDKIGKWKPIEYWNQQTFLCGTGHQDYLLNSKHFIVSSVKRYHGDYKTKLRVKFTSYNKVFYSNEYSDYINYSQFDSTDVIQDIKKRFSNRKPKEINNRINRSFLNPTY